VSEPEVTGRPGQPVVRRRAGRVLVTDPAAKVVPSMPIEDGDRVYVPPNPTSVGVFGSVFNTGSFVYAPTMAVGDYLKLAGGPTRGADKGSTFVLRANGTVMSSLQARLRWLG